VWILKNRQKEDKEEEWVIPGERPLKILRKKELIYQEEKDQYLLIADSLISLVVRPFNDEEKKNHLETIINNICERDPDIKNLLNPYSKRKKLLDFLYESLRYRPFGNLDLREEQLEIRLFYQGLLIIGDREHAISKLKETREDANLRIGERIIISSEILAAPYVLGYIGRSKPSALLFHPKLDPNNVGFNKTNGEGFFTMSHPLSDMLADPLYSEYYPNQKKT